MLEKQLKTMLHEMETNPLFIKCQQKGLVKNTKNSIIDTKASVKVGHDFKTVYTKIVDASEPKIINRQQYVIIKQLFNGHIYFTYNINRHSVDIIDFNKGINIQTLYEKDFLVESIIADGLEHLSKNQIDDWYKDVSSAKQSVTLHD